MESFLSTAFSAVTPATIIVSIISGLLFGKILFKTLDVGKREVFIAGVLGFSYLTMRMVYNIVLTGAIVQSTPSATSGLGGLVLYSIFTVFAIIGKR